MANAKKAVSKKTTAKKSTAKKNTNVTDNQTNVTDTPQDVPTFTALSLHKLDNNEWVVLTFTIEGDKVVNVTSTHPNLRAIAIDELKIETVRQFLDQ